MKHTNATLKVETMAHKSRVLIVEDDKTQALIMEKMLHRLGYIPIGIADTADKAIKMFTSRKPDLVLMDIKLIGEKDGIEAAEEMLKLWYAQLIYISGIDVFEYSKRLKQTHYIDYLKKPINETILSSALSKCYI